MNFLKKIARACAVLAALAAGSATAAPITLTFEGVGDYHTVDTFYAGGTGSNNTSGPDHGIVFGSSFYGLIDSDAGGSGVIANMPSGSTVLMFVESDDTAINMAAGFENAFSFYFSAVKPTFVNVFEGQNGTGELLASISLSGNNDACLDIENQFCHFARVSLAFDGVAQSVVFGGELGGLVIDDLAFGAEAAPGEVPEPATLGLTALGLAGLLAARRKARAQR